MIKSSPYRHLFFDLDHTLWDYDQNAKDALEDIHKDFQLSQYGLVPLHRFIESFRKANLQVWDWFDENRVNQHSLREKRMELVFEEFGLPFSSIPGFHEAYKTRCSSGQHLMPGCKEVLEILKASDFTMHIITNGFEETQIPKLENGGILSYFSTIVTSDRANSKKPDPAFFHFALQAAGAVPANSLIIGDGLRTDIAGAQNLNLPVVWYNPEARKNENAGLWEIRHLMDLLKFLDN